MTGPKPWLDGGEGASELAVALLRQGDEAFAPPSGRKQKAWMAIQERAATAAALAQATGAQTVGVHAAATTASSGGVVKAILAVIVAGAVGGGAMWASAPSEPVAAPPAPVALQRTIAEPASQPAAPIEPAAMPEPKTVPAAPRDERSPAKPAEARIVAELPVPPVPAAVEPGAVEGFPPVAPSTVTSEEARVAQATSELRAESAKVREAREALRRGAPETALALLQRSEAEFPLGQLGEEREALTIESLWRKGARDAALARARAFFAKHPVSPHSDRLRQILQ